MVSYLQGFTSIANLLSQAINTAGQAYKTAKGADNPALNHRHDSIRENINSTENTNQQGKAIEEAQESQKRIEEEKKKADLEKQLKIKKLQSQKLEQQISSQRSAREVLIEDIKSNKDLSAVRNHVSKDLKAVKDTPDSKRQNEAKSKTLVNVKSFLEGEKQTRELNSSESKLLSMINVSIAETSDGKESKRGSVNVSNLATSIKDKPKDKLSKNEKAFVEAHKQSQLSELKIKQIKVSDVKASDNGSQIDIKDTQKANVDTTKNNKNDNGKKLNTVSDQVDTSNAYAKKHAVV